jgi:dUTP pyrophosphatase
VSIKKGEKLGQGVFRKYLIVDNDNAKGVRQGGFGSTGK